jgi:hypothetical protein
MILFKMFTKEFVNSHAYTKSREWFQLWLSLQRYQKHGEGFLIRIVPAKGDEIWFSLMHVETKEQSKQCMHTHSPKMPNSFKEPLSVRKLMCSCFLGEEKRADGGIHAIRDHNNVRSVLRNTTKLSGMLTSGEVLPHDNELFALVHCFPTGSCLTILSTTTITCLPILRSRCDHSASTMMNWKALKSCCAHRRQTLLTQAYTRKHVFPIQVPQFLQ